MTGEEYHAPRRSAFAIAYRMLDRVGEAEDVVQEVPPPPPGARGRRADRVAARHLSTVVSRLSLDHLRSARVRRETYAGEWLPEPLFFAERIGSVGELELLLLLRDDPDRPGTALDAAARRHHMRLRPARRDERRLRRRPHRRAAPRPRAAPVGGRRLRLLLLTPA